MRIQGRLQSVWGGGIGGQPKRGGRRSLSIDVGARIGIVGREPRFPDDERGLIPDDCLLYEEFPAVL